MRDSRKGVKGGPECVAVCRRFGGAAVKGAGKGGDPLGGVVGDKGPVCLAADLKVFVARRPRRFVESDGGLGQKEGDERDMVGDVVGAFGGVRVGSDAEGTEEAAEVGHVLGAMEGIAGAAILGFEGWAVAADRQAEDRLERPAAEIGGEDEPVVDVRGIDGGGEFFVKPEVGTRETVVRGADQSPRPGRDADPVGTFRNAGGSAERIGKSGGNGVTRGQEERIGWSQRGHGRVSRTPSRLTDAEPGNR